MPVRHNRRLLIPVLHPLLGEHRVLVVMVLGDGAARSGLKV